MFTYEVIKVIMDRVDQKLIDNGQSLWIRTDTTPICTYIYYVREPYESVYFYEKGTF